MPRPIFIPLEVDYADDKDIAKVARFVRTCEARALRDLLVQMWCYCKQELSDGHVPIEQIGKLAYPDSLKIALRDADRLVDIGVVERTDTGYYLPGFLKRNKSRAQVEAVSIAKAEAGRKGGIASGVARHAGSKPEADAKHSASDLSDNEQITDGISTSRDRDSLTSRGTKLLAGNRTRASKYGDQSKHSASRTANTEGRGQRTEDRDTATTTVSGDRDVTTGDRRATFPTHCQDHRYVETPGPCGGCKTAREAIERREQRTHLAVVADCTRCGGTGWIEDADGSPVRKCDHRRNA